MEGEYEQHYSEAGLWSKLRKYARVIGKEVLSNVLILYYVGMDKDTPVWAKTVVFSTLGYLIFPLDMVPDLLPGGLVDDSGAIVVALASIAGCISEKHRALAKTKVAEWFPADTPVEPPQAPAQ